MNGTILVVGATGHFAGTVAPALASRGAVVRGMVRDRAGMPSLPNHAQKAPVEAAVLNSQLEYSFLHPTVPFWNHAGAWDGILKIRCHCRTLVKQDAIQPRRLPRCRRGFEELASREQFAPASWTS
jgi:hypothetical protein